MKHSKVFKTRKDKARRTALAVIFICSLLELLSAVAAADQAPEKGLTAVNSGLPANANAIAQQAAALAAMAESIAQQRASVNRQTGASESGSGFFILPAPVRTLVRAASYNCDPLPEEQIGTLVEQAAKRELLQPALVRSVMRQESGFRPCAISSKGAMGLMQLMPGTASQFNVKDPFDAESNVNAGAKLLKLLLDRYNGSVEKALSAYNAGTAAVDASTSGIPNIPETIDYVRQIISVLPRSN